MLIIWISFIQLSSVGYHSRKWTSLYTNQRFGEDSFNKTSLHCYCKSFNSTVTFKYLHFAIEWQFNQRHVQQFLVNKCVSRLDGLAETIFRRIHHLSESYSLLFNRQLDPDGQLIKTIWSVHIFISILLQADNLFKDVEDYDSWLSLL